MRLRLDGPTACRRLSFGCALFLLSALPAAGLDPTRRADQYLIDTWDGSKLLNAKTVSAIEQTRDGYLWLGTNAGLLRFDGFDFELFEPANTPAFQAAQVRALLEGQDGSLWIGVYGGGVVQLRNGRFKSFGKEQGLPSLLVQALAVDPGGGLWIGAEGGGVARLEHGKVVETFTRAQGLLRDEVRSILVSRRGDLWIGTERGGLTRRRGGELRTWTREQGLPSDTVMAMYEGVDDALWLATTAGLARLGDDGQSLRTFGIRDGLPTDYLFSVTGDNDGNLWVGTGGGGLSRWTGGGFSTLSTAGGLPNEVIWALREDREGGLWVGTEGGLARLRDSLFTHHGERQGLAADQVRGLLEVRSGALRIATAKGLNRLENGQISVVGKAQGLPVDYVWSLLEAKDGSLWVSTDGAGLAHLDGDATRIYTEKDGLGNNMVWSLAEGPDGAIWAGTQSGGVSRFAAGRWTRLTRKDGLGADVVRSLLVDHTGTVWAGTMGGGLSRIAGDTITTYTTKDGLGSDSVLALYEDRELNLWVGAYSGGLSLFRDGRFVTFARRQGFVTDSVGSLIEDDLGFIWFSGNTALHRARRQDLLALFTAAPGARADALEVDSFSRENGLVGAVGAGFTPAAWKRRDGRLLFSSSKGMAMVDPRQVERPQRPAPTIVESLLANHREVELDPPPVLPAGTFDVEIHYTAPSLDAPRRTRFRYRLEGYDRDWVEVGGRRVAYYPHLPPGKFAFRVAAAGAGGAWTEGTPLPIRLQPFFYQTGWFKLLLAGLAAWLLYGLYRLRAGRLEARAAVAEERNRMSREMHDTIAQDLMSILMKTRIAQSAARKRAAEPDPHLEAIGNLAAGSLAETRRLLQALRPPALDEKDLAQALRDLAGSLSAGLEVTIGVQTRGDGTIAPAVEAELFRIAKEAMGNALRYSGAHHIEVELTTEGGEVALTVRDDGRGFDPEQTNGGFGLIGMRERAVSLGGSLTIRSVAGADTGTEITARAPLKGREG